MTSTDLGDTDGGQTRSGGILGVDERIDEGVEVRELRLRVAAQDRLIAQMLVENVSIHELRRSTDELALLYQRFRGTFLFDKLLALFKRVQAFRQGI